MFAINGLSRVAATVVKPGASRRGVAFMTDIVPSPPAYRISLAEKLVHGVFLTLGVLGYPLYAMYHVASIKQAEYDALEVPEQWQEWEKRQKN